MQKLKQIYEGKAKKVYGTDDPELYIVDYKDDATAFNGLKKGTIAGKGVINNRMSNLLMQMLEKNGIPTPPTLALIVKRQQEIENFTPQQYWVPHRTLWCTYR